MLKRVISATGVVTYRSPLLAGLGISHGFSTRCGGVSGAPFHWLNLGNPPGAVQDAPERISENYHRFQAAIGLKEPARCWVHQVHGAQVAVIRPGEAFENGQPADALVGTDPTRSLTVRVADCVPILLSSEDGRVVAAVHAGWRGIIAGVIPAAVARLKQEGDRTGASATMFAAIGPCISAESYEVGREVLESFHDRFGARAPVQAHRPDQGRVDLAEAVALQLVESGLKTKAIDRTDRCTFRDRDEFFSHRRENGLAGRMAAMIAPAAA